MPLGRVNRRGIYKHNRNIVLNRVNPLAFAAFQAFPVPMQSYRLLADWANQHIEQILRNHSGFILQPKNEDHVPAGLFVRSQNPTRPYASKASSA